MPDEVLKVRPLGSDGEIDQEEIPPPRFVGESDVIARPTSDTTGDPA